MTATNTQREPMSRQQRWAVALAGYSVLAAGGLGYVAFKSIVDYHDQQSAVFAGGLSLAAGITTLVAGREARQHSSHTPEEPSS